MGFWGINVTMEVVPARVPADLHPWRSEPWGSARTGWIRPSTNVTAPLYSALSAGRKGIEPTSTVPEEPAGRETSTAFSVHKRRAHQGAVVEEGPLGRR
jgi:hypothetical protein